MEWLEAAAAFSVVMMVFSTLATVVLETCHRVFRLRERGLEKLVTTTYSQVILPHLKREGSLQALNKFKTKSTRIHGVASHQHAPWYERLFNALMGVKSEGGQLMELSTAGFVERLAQTDEGQALLAEGRRKGEAHLDKVIHEVAAKYEAFGDSASHYFQRRSRLISCLVGLVLAFSLNLDVVHLFTTLLTDQSVRIELIEQGDPRTLGNGDLFDHYKYVGRRLDYETGERMPLQKK
jgi:hypothetical protein